MPRPARRLVTAKPRSARIATTAIASTAICRVRAPSGTSEREAGRLCAQVELEMISPPTVTTRSRNQKKAR